MSQWTGEEERILRDICAQNKPFENFARKLPGRSPIAMSKKAARMKISKKRERKGRAPTRQVDVLMLLRTRPMFVHEIAAVCGITNETVRDVLRRLAEQGKAHVREKVLLGKTKRSFLWAYGAKHQQQPSPFVGLTGTQFIPVGQPGRVIRNLHDDDLEQAA